MIKRKNICLECKYHCYIGGGLVCIKHPLRLNKRKCREYKRLRYKKD